MTELSKEVVQKIEAKKTTNTERQYKKPQRYVLRAYFSYVDNKGNKSVDVEILPIYEYSQAEIERKINENIEVYENFTLYNHDWNRTDILTYGYEILTPNEFWGDS